MNTMQLALIKKDIQSITSNKQIVSVMLIVPIVLAIVFPSAILIVSAFIPEANSDFQTLLELLPLDMREGDMNQLIGGLVLNKLMPVYFLLIPVMASSVMAASSFVGEKEKRTLETLLYSPLSIKQLFTAKILAGFSVGMMVSLISFAAMIIVIEAEMLLLTGAAIMPDISWLIVMLLIAPAVSLLAIGITVRGSAKAQTVEESQQSAVFLVFPIIALVVAQFSGVILLSGWILLALGAVLALLAYLVMRGVAGKFDYEKLLKQ